MLIIDIEKINEEVREITRTKYQEFVDEVNRLLSEYENEDVRNGTRRLEEIAKIIGLKKENNKWIKSDEEKSKTDLDGETLKVDWDIGIGIKGLIPDKTSIEEVPIPLLLAYEYCLGVERITDKKVQFDDIMNKLFSGVQKFRIGNPVPGDDDECLYGKALNDESAIPVTSKLYRMVMHAGAQHLDYFKDGEPTGAVFMFEKGTIENFAIDENGNPVPMELDGVNFMDLSEGQPLLANLRQLAFHEWTHNSEKEIINPTQEESIKHEYQAIDGKIYRNYERVENYVQFVKKAQESELELPNIAMTSKGEFKEPQYEISTQRDEHGNQKMSYIVRRQEDDEKRPLHELRFGLQKRALDRPYCVSTGMTTLEVKPNGEKVIHNISTEGWVEDIARHIARAVGVKETDLDLTKYYEYVAMADKVIESRGEEQTIADFLMHSSSLKKELESKQVNNEEGKTVDGLHYISDYADKVQGGETERIIFYKTYIKELSDDHKKYLFGLFKSGNISNEDMRSVCSIMNMNAEEVIALIQTYTDIRNREQAFFDGIPEKLGYRTKDEIVRNSDTQSAEQRKKSFLAPRKINTPICIEAEEQTIEDQRTMDIERTGIV